MAEVGTVFFGSVTIKKEVREDLVGGGYDCFIGEAEKKVEEVEV